MMMMMVIIMKIWIYLVVDDYKTNDSIGDMMMIIKKCMDVLDSG